MTDLNFQKGDAVIIRYADGTREVSRVQQRFDLIGKFVTVESCHGRKFAMDGKSVPDDGSYIVYAYDEEIHAVYAENKARFVKGLLEQQQSEPELFAAKSWYEGLSSELQAHVDTLVSDALDNA